MSEKILNQFNQFCALNNKDGAMPISDKRWFIDNSKEGAGDIEGHYTLQDLWAARLVHLNLPEMHYDVGSRFDGFITHCLSFTQVTMFDIRPLPITIDGLHFFQTDATLLLNIPDNSIRSLSSLHAVEHFGLGRYGDPLDPDGHIKAIKSLQRVLAPSGNLYFSVPLGVETVVFNAHRVFYPKTIVSLFDELKLVEFTIIDRVCGKVERNVDWKKVTEKGHDYFCGCFHFTKGL